MVNKNVTNRYFLIKNNSKISVYFINLSMMKFYGNKLPNSTTMMIMNNWIFKNKPYKCSPYIYIYIYI